MHIFPIAIRSTLWSVKRGSRVFAVEFAFYRAAECRRGLAIRFCLSVRPSVIRVHCNKTEERYV